MGPPIAAPAKNLPDILEPINATSALGSPKAELKAASFAEGPIPEARPATPAIPAVAASADLLVPH